MMSYRPCFHILLLICVTLCHHGDARVRLQNNGYEGVTVFIKDSVIEAQHPQLLTRIQEVFTLASRKLYKATNNRAYFRNITVVVPTAWSSRPEFQSISAFSQGSEQIITVDKARGGAMDIPHVMGLVECGKGGQEMRLTTEFLLSAAVTHYGTHENVLVHEWGHLRWGLFDEYPSVRDNLSSGKSGEFLQFYLSNNIWSPVTCTRQMEGVSVINYDKSKPCDLQSGRTVPRDCKFFPTADQQVEASLMSFQWLDSLASFCDRDDDNTDPAYRHNSEAPNLQNKLCMGRSAWEVMRAHPDFASGNNPPGAPDKDTTPTFSFVQPRGGRVIVFVLDVSGSMNGLKLMQLGQAVELVVGTTIPLGTRVAMVEFESQATVLVDVMLIDSDADREFIISRIPTGVRGGTSIGSGLLMAIQVLDRNHINTKGCVIILVTDGENGDSAADFDDVMEKVVESGVAVTTISVTQAADSMLKQLAEDTGGQHYTYLQTSSISFADAMSQAVSTENSVANANSPERMFSALFEVGPDSPVESEFVVDEGLGDSTTVTIMTDATTDITLRVSQESSNFVFVESRAGTTMAVFSVSDTTLAGKYDFSVESSKATKTNVFVSSKPTSPDAAILRVTSWISNSTIDFTGSASLVYTYVEKGGFPVFDAKVVAVLESDATKNTSFELKDSGIGPDSIAGDGTYSAYLLPSYFTGNGRYNIKITVQGSSSTYTRPSSMIGRPMINPEYAAEEDEDAIELVGEFQRFSLPGEITVVNFEVNLGDITAPARVTDLQIDAMVNHVDSGTMERGVNYTLSWSAVGDDLNVGQASRYDIRLDEDLQTLLTDVEAARQVNASLQGPQLAGTLETLTLTFMKTDCNGTCYLGLRAVDKAGHHGDISNIVAIDVTFAPIEREPNNEISAGNFLKPNLFSVIVSALAFKMACKSTL